MNSLDLQKKIKKIVERMIPNVLLYNNTHIHTITSTSTNNYKDSTYIYHIRTKFSFTFLKIIFLSHKYFIILMYVLVIINSF
jgi:hypothetical protein